MAVKESMPYIPKLEMVNEPPWYSCGWSLLSRALPASVLMLDEMEARPLLPTSVTMGVMSPLGVATAMAMSAFLYLQERQVLISINRYGRRVDYILSNEVTHPGRVGFWDVLQSNS